jgi:pSer/pThr/pTyr-binding forkhead associated (FHA) protein
VVGSPLDAHQATPAELRERIAAERRGQPFLVYRDGAGAQRIMELTERDRVSVGRSPECDLPLTWDVEVSRLHAEFERVGDEWVAVDDGLSSNGTFIGGERVTGRRRLHDGDVLYLGSAAIAFRQPAGSALDSTRLSGQRRTAATITPAQRRVLVALCRPFKGGAADATPATNPQIADELVLTVAAVKTHLRSICRAFGIDELPQQEKRRRLVALAFASGLVRERDL